MDIDSGVSYRQLSKLTSTSGFKFRVGPFHLRLTSKLPSISAHLHQHYNHYPRLEADAFIDFHLSVDRRSGIRSVIKPQVIFALDGYQPFTPLPLDQAAAQFEWGFNWCIAGSMHQYLIIHSAVIEKNGVSIIMPGQPGSGKSTLCAALLFEGWRLLSDEMALISLADLTIQPVPRPVSLKNKSIDIIRHHYSNAKFSALINGTSKGTVCNLEAPLESIRQQDIPANPGLIVFPKYDSKARPFIRPKEKANACIELIDNTFNFNILQGQGFQAITDIIDKADCYDIGYQNLQQALDAIEEIAGAQD